MRLAIFRNCNEHVPRLIFIHCLGIGKYEMQSTSLGNSNIRNRDKSNISRYYWKIKKQTTVTIIFYTITIFIVGDLIIVSSKNYNLIIMYLIIYLSSLHHRDPGELNIDKH